MAKHVLAFPSSDSIAPALRSYIVRAQDHGIARHGVFKVAVSGGSLPKTLALALFTPSDVDDIHLDKWEVFFADERAVPLDDPDSNYLLFKNEILDRLPAGAGRPTVHAIDVEHLDDAQELADTYEKQLIQSFASRDSVKLPIFDLILLGCGPDGHTASLFPGHELLREDVAWVAPIEDSPKPPPRRITLTMPVLTHAVQVAFVATGASKRDMLWSVLETGEGHSLPCAIVSSATGDRCTWFVDEDAVKGMTIPIRRPSLPA